MSKHRPRGRKARTNPVPMQQASRVSTGQEAVVKGGSARGRKKPFYDQERRELRVGRTVVKRLRQESDAQEIVLLAFQEDNWPYRIDDPLAGKNGQEPKRRLATAVANLNRRQFVPLIQFGVASQGTAVTWEYRQQRQESDSTATGERQ